MKNFTLAFFLFGLLAVLIACQQSSTTNLVVETPLEEPVEISLDSSKNHTYTWLEDYSVENKLINRIQTPEGYKRAEHTQISFASWLQHIPLHEGKPKVLSYSGEPIWNQSGHVAVVNIDVGAKDLQQCADATMRLRAEYLLSTSQDDAIHFNYTSGHKAAWSKWKDGYRPKISGNNVSWNKTASTNATYTNFMKYMENVFSFCGTYSLSQELPAKSVDDINAGDIFLQGGFPGHAIIVMDICEHEEKGEKLFMVAQSYMPAQSIHILKNENDESISPWYSADFTGQLITPSWTFNREDLKSF